MFSVTEKQNQKKADFDGAYDRPRGLLQPTWPRSLTDKRRNTTYSSINNRRVGIRCVRWAAAAERCGRTAPVYRVDGRVPISATRRVPVSDRVVALRSWHVDFWVRIRVRSQVSRFSSSSLLSRCVAVIDVHTTNPASPFGTNVASSNAYPATGLIRYMAETILTPTRLALLRMVDIMLRNMSHIFRSP